MRKYNKLPTLAMLLAVGIILSYIESVLPIPLPMGFKLGFANIAAVFALYKLGFIYALIISVLRVIIVNAAFGSLMSMFFGLSGALLSIAVMYLLKNVWHFSVISVSAVGGAFHNIGQVAVCAVFLSSTSAFWYLTLLIPFGILAGSVMGIISKEIIRRID